jgi:hypothetical protein
MMASREDDGVSGPTSGTALVSAPGNNACAAQRGTLHAALILTS